jgi:hypothetical protein
VGLDIALTTKRFMKEAVFVDIVEVIYTWSMNRWPADKEVKEIGMSFHLFPLYSLFFYFL